MPLTAEQRLSIEREEYRRSLRIRERARRRAVRRETARLAGLGMTDPGRTAEEILGEPRMDRKGRRWDPSTDHDQVLHLVLLLGAFFFVLFVLAVISRLL